MAKYIIRFKVNPEAWPTDQAGALKAWEGVVGGGTALLESGTLAEINWTSNLAGYAIMEATSKSAALGVATPFFPLFNQEIDEVLPWAEAIAAILGAAKAAAGQ